jgi:hypothetical protein
MILDRVREEFVVPSSGESRVGTCLALIQPVLRLQNLLGVSSVGLLIELAEHMSSKTIPPLVGVG